MLNHVKPTKEELEANINKTLEDVAKLDAEENKKKEEVLAIVDENLNKDPEPTPSKAVEEEEEEVIEPSKSPDLEPVPIPDINLEPEPTPSPDYKKKFGESSLEGQLLNSKNKAMNEAIIKANELPDPTEEELTKANPEYDLMTDTEKVMAKELFINKRFRETITEATKPFVDMENWRNKVVEFVEGEANLKKYPNLRGKEEKFMEFAVKESRKGVDFELLMDAFEHHLTLQAPKKENNGQMFPTGTGGPGDKDKPKSDKLTLAQGQILKETDYRKYTEMLKAGKIADE